MLHLFGIACDGFATNRNNEYGVTRFRRKIAAQVFFIAVSSAYANPNAAKTTQILS